MVNNGNGDRRRRIRLSAELAREQVKAAQARRELQGIRKLEAAEQEIRELKRVRFGRSRLGRGLSLGRKVFRKTAAPAARGAFRAVGRVGTKALEQQARAAARRRPTRRRRRKKRQW